MVFESFHLPPGVNALEEMGIPIQTLHRLADLMDFPEKAGVDQLGQFIRDNQHAWVRSVGYVDRMFIQCTLCFG